MIQPGKYTAKVVDYSVIENDKDEPVVVIKFKFGENTWAWTGGFGSDKAKERTLKTLLVVGLTSDSLEDLCDGPSSGLLDMNTEVEIVVEESEYNGKKRTQIAYVNPLGGRAFGEAISKQNARAKFGGMNIKGELAALGFKKKAVVTPDVPF
jgi:hypothetical protein